MQSGLVTYDGVPEFEAAFLADPQRTFTPQQLLNYALDKPLQFPPGTKYDYCNTNTVLLGLVVEKLSGQRLADYVSDNILVPLKLTHTSVPQPPRYPNPIRRATPSSTEPKESPPTGTRPGRGPTAT